MVDTWNAAVLNEAVANGSIGGGGEGATALSGLTDVNLTDPTDGDLLSYDGSSGKWVNTAPTIPDAEDIPYDQTLSVFDMLSYETPVEYTDSNTDISITYKEYVYGKIVWLVGVITPLTDGGIGDIKTISLTHLVNAPLVNTISNNMLTVSVSDRTPQSRLVLKADKSMELVGKVTADRDGQFQVIYLI